MILPLVVALLQTTPPSRDARPVRVWLGSSGVLVRGTPVRVYVQTAQDGNLIVLHRRTDGRIEVLFPVNPSDDPVVRAGTYEIQATPPPSRVAFVVAEPDGSGLVLAALTAKTYRFDEFVRAAAWSPDALASSWNGADGEGVLSDIVQRMLGDGYFNYDIATYTVAPAIYAAQQDTGLGPPPPPPPYPVYPTCTDCTFIGYQENVFESAFLCDPFFATCLGDGRFGHARHRRDQPSTPSPATRTIALAMRGPPSASLIPKNGRAAPATSAAIGPRSRAAVMVSRPVALGPGQPAVARAPAVVTVRRRVDTATPTTPVQVVRLALSPMRVRAEPEDAPQNTQPVALTGLVVTPRPPRSTAQTPARPATPVPEGIAAPAAAMPRARGLAMASGGGAAVETPPPATGAERGRTVALPPALFHGAQARLPAARTGSRRR